MLDLLIVVYIQFVTMLIRLQKVQSQDLSVCVASLAQSYENDLYQKLWMWVSYILLHYKYINILYRNVCILYMHYIHALQVCIPTTGIVTHYIGEGCQSPNPKEIHCLNRNSVWFVCFFQESTLAWNQTWLYFVHSSLRH